MARKKQGNGGDEDEEDDWKSLEVAMAAIVTKQNV